MQKLLKATLLLVTLAAMQTQAFAYGINCKFKTDGINGINSIQLTDEALFINGNLEIPIQRTEIRCGTLGERERLDGLGNGLKVVLKTCNEEARIQGHLIDSVQAQAASIECE